MNTTPIEPTVRSLAQAFTQHSHPTHSWVLAADAPRWSIFPGGKNPTYNYPLRPVSEMPSINVRWAKKKAKKMGSVMMERWGNAAGSKYIIQANPLHTGESASLSNGEKIERGWR